MLRHYDFEVYRDFPLDVKICGYIEIKIHASMLNIMYGITELGQENDYKVFETSKFTTTGEIEYGLWGGNFITITIDNKTDTSYNLHVIMR